ncbi:DUF2268 domain-containing protein [Fodinicola acaciae]|uniref:DUF2268 domain-containing protein n=1 Tax=Fodinicola acaciae TaxID=2681555 RepID=UPI0013D0B3FD|nr:DUF2268 domain-containing putative Zn-dependent protease [Fodinicola acaciae]
MKIIVHDTDAGMRELLDRPVGQRRDALLELVRPLGNPYVPMDRPEMHRGLAKLLDGDDARFAAALEQLREAKVWDRISESMAAAWDRLEPVGVRHADEIHVVLLLGDPDDAHLVGRSSGYLGMGGIPGVVMLTMWPTETSLAKISHAAAHELHHNVRYANVVWNPATVTVGEWVISEGLAEAFARELAGPQGLCPWTTALGGAQLDAAYERITGSIDVAGMENLTPYIFGDAVAAEMGQQPVGVPDFAGYAVGLRIVDAYLAATGRTAAESVAQPLEDLLAYV